ncbi:hypothetical protein [Litoreibacter roseus]|uniref:Uncharacterized protein n=1 Tax=Litoreibacter roseus TaxID=2601869 RepID=A0A6N6JNL4_9RHOB|nr:hypothetical protein [Litoreibacter roseus]GFE66962.1 hypothetical protein KIN_40360 [Litoreibacter roseus]
MIRQTKRSNFFRATMTVLCFGIVQTATPVAAQDNDQIIQLFPSNGQGCTDTVKISLTNAIRAGIESEVLRGEEALKPPASIAALGCLDNLFDVNLDIAIQVPNLQAIFAAAVSAVEDQICSFAQSKMNELTAQITDLLQLPTFEFLPIGGLTGNATTTIGGVDLNVGGGQQGTGVTVNGTTVSPNNLDAVYELIYGGGNE